MKFEKEFKSQMVQEWREAYMDYTYLKSLLKDVMKTKRRTKPPTPLAESLQRNLKRKMTLYRAFSGLTSRVRNKSPRNGSPEDEAILVSTVPEEEEEEGGGGGEGKYLTMFLNAADETGESELVFFRQLDHEFNKVNRFYKSHVKEVMAEAEDLSKQMDALIALRIKVEIPVVAGTNVADFDMDSAVHPINGTNPEFPNMDVIQEVEMSLTASSENGSTGSRDENSNSERGSTGTQLDVLGFRPHRLEVLDHVKINVEASTPVSTVKNIILCTKPDLSYSKEELRKAEEIMSRAFVEFHQKLRLLKSYSFMNQLAFGKIMKKYDKITSRNASRVYINMVDHSYLGCSVEVAKLMESVEATFIKHFANGNHSKGMGSLRLKKRKERHRYTFILGLLTGFAIALLIALAVIIRLRNIHNSAGGPQYMENIFPLYSFFGFIILHMILYAGNIYFWRRYRVNYPFIFEFKQGTELGYREVLLVSSGLAVLTLAAVLSNLEMEMEPKTNSFQALTELVPLGLLILVILITICPLNILYRSSRYFLVGCIFHCICAPFYKVYLSDFFLADQLTSQVQAFRNLEFYICYYGWGDFKRRTNTCRGNNVYEVFYFVVAMIPYWMRFLQCLRRLFEEKDSLQGINSLRYLSTIVAVAMRTSYDLNKGVNWKILAAATSGFATIFSVYWDLVIDWGLLRPNSVNPWLRDKLVIPNKSVYFIAMVLNCVLRLAWMQTVLGITRTPSLHRTAFVAVIACLEIIRRGIWNFFRLENEHLNNVGKYRAVKSVPLPFYYDDADDDEHKRV